MEASREARGCHEERFRFEETIRRLAEEDMEIIIALS